MDDPRFSVVLAATDCETRDRLLRLLGEQFHLVALRSDAEGTFHAVHTRRPDVLVCDAECGEEVLFEVDGGDPPPATWIVVLAEEAAIGLPQGVSRVSADASDRRLVSAVSAAGRFARTGLHTRRRPGRFVAPRPAAASADVLAFRRLDRRADAG